MQITPSIIHNISDVSNSLNCLSMVIRILSSLWWQIAHGLVSSAFRWYVKNVDTLSHVLNVACLVVVSCEDEEREQYTPFSVNFRFSYLMIAILFIEQRVLDCLLPNVLYLASITFSISLISFLQQSIFVDKCHHLPAHYLWYIFIPLVTFVMLGYVYWKAFIVLNLVNQSIIILELIHPIIRS